MGIDESLLASLAADAAFINGEAEAANQKIKDVEQALQKAHCGEFEWSAKHCKIAYKRCGTHMRLCTLRSVAPAGFADVALLELKKDERIAVAKDLDAFVEALAADVKRRREKLETNK